jgi:hypothetical protein
MSEEISSQIILAVVSWIVFGIAVNLVYKYAKASSLTKKPNYYMIAAIVFILVVFINPISSATSYLIVVVTKFLKNL